ncbi:hypothetical protein BDV26DRAFT_79704 [Aspergillus bertholletiae]|uniref:Uncharacterized protein n=1 Tax=Aspergillus bertholletiae TaxID=1226010 RepID=A0A5N7AVZ9_9EURO|nr:hypothetical protein BDV26DRAFT_79704 [Aspergillus bertholletiae]
MLGSSPSFCRISDPLVTLICIPGGFQRQKASASCIDDVQISLSLKPASFESRTSCFLHTESSVLAPLQLGSKMNVLEEMGCRGWRCEGPSNHGGCLLRGDKGLVNRDVIREGEQPVLVQTWQTWAIRMYPTWISLGWAFRVAGDVSVHL